MNALSTITILPENKREIESFKLKVLSELKSGTYYILDVAARFKAIETVLKEIQSDKEFKDMAVNEAAKYGKVAEIKGHKIEVAELGVKYDFSECGDSKLKEIESEINRLTEQKKARENWLKTLKETMPNEDGEPCNPPAKTSTTGIKITLAK